MRPGLARIALADRSEAYALTDLCGPVQVGDMLLVNTCALDLQLGSGGAHVVQANLSSPHRSTVRSSAAARTSRVVKARYLAEQLPVDAYEEATGPIRDDADTAPLPVLDRTRVVLCVLHSHALALAVALRDATGTAPGYVMSDGGALPFVLSDLAADCLQRGVIAEAVSAGQAFGAPIEAVTVASGVAALARRNIEHIVVAPGPGHLGTGHPLGFSGLDLVGHAAVLDALGAATALAARASSIEPRTRHRGISHHTRTMAALGPARTVVPVPTRPAAETTAGDAAWIETLGRRAVLVTPTDVADALARSGLSVTSMGRPLEGDELACEWIGAAAAWLAASS
ncbi:DUF3866 family protein [Candidatus Poriferisodalis sp.]|uniref:DUF3866 family protein n=1 Tax=Candidatus Poriferisodalis sp. TaxID=3101277 RepID=UPI003B029909